MAAKPRKDFARKRTTYTETPNGKIATGCLFTFKTEPATVREITFTDFPDAIRAEAEGNGFRQKIGDHWNTADTVTEAVVACDTMIDRLYNGDWKSDREGFGIADEWYIAAIAADRNKTPDQITATWENLSDERLATIKADPKIKALAEQARSEARVNKADAAVTLDEF